MNGSRGWTHQDYWSWRSHDHDRGVHAAIIHVAVADTDEAYGAYAACDNNILNNTSNNDNKANNKNDDDIRLINFH